MCQRIKNSWFRNRTTCVLLTCALVWIAGDAAASPDDDSERNLADIQASLNASIDVAFEGTLFETAILDVSARAGLIIFVDWFQLKFWGVDESIPVDLMIEEIAAGDAIDLLVQQAFAIGGDPSGGPTWRICDDLVVISTEEEFDRLAKHTQTFGFERFRDAPAPLGRTP